MSHIKHHIQAAEFEIAEESLAARSTYESKLIHDFATSNQSKIYQHICNLPKSSSIPSTMFNNGDSATNDIHKASLFNKHIFFCIYNQQH